MEFLIGILVGGLLYYVFVDRKKSSGTFILDMRETSDKPFELVFSESLNSIYTKKHIILDVKVREDNSPN